MIMYDFNMKVIFILVWSVLFFCSFRSVLMVCLLVMLFIVVSVFVLDNVVLGDVDIMLGLIIMIN